MMKDLLWSSNKNRINDSNLAKFIQYINNKYKISIQYNMSDLHQWSLKYKYDFWRSVGEFCDVKYSKQPIQDSNNATLIKEHKFFPDAELNFAENLLRKKDDSIAMIFDGEGQKTYSWTYAKLYNNVAYLALFLRNNRVKKGDVVCGYLPNTPENIAAALATISIGAIWCSCSPDFGVAGVLDRLGQTNPKVMFITDGYYYKGKTFDVVDKAFEIVKQMPSVVKTVMIPYISNKKYSECENYYDIVSSSPQEIIFEQLPFNWPVYILFTSGTTGKPKCIIHGAGGTLLQHLKEHQLHCDMKKGDNVFYYTTCSWMMWHWIVSALASETTLILCDGFPLHNDGKYLFDLIDKYKISFFGVSAKYIDSLIKLELAPMTTYNLSSLRTMASTGGPLSEDSFRYVYDKIKKDVHLVSFSGGGDIVSCLLTGSIFDPVYAGELQSPGLGMAVDIYNDNGKPVATEEFGYLVCTQPFPSKPLGFWDDESGERYHNAYYAVFDNIWDHGDWIKKTKNGGYVISGRSDSVLNPHGIRIGTAEIYSQVQKIEEVTESVAVGYKHDNDEDIILFVILANNKVLDDALIAKIKKILRDNATPRHVPYKIVQVTDIPRTRNNKISEIAVKCILNHQEVRNKETLANPECLTQFDIYQL